MDEEIVNEISKTNFNLEHIAMQKAILKKWIKEVFMFKKSMDLVSIVADKGTTPPVVD